jgi:hypothetical protein
MSAFAILIYVLGALASTSTLAKNEFHCALYELANCTAPQVRLPLLTVTQPVGSPAMSAIVRQSIPYEGVTGYANPSLGGR